MVLLIQVPLKQKDPMRFDDTMKFGFPAAEGVCYSPLDGGSDVEEAVIGHGTVEGHFTEIDDLDIERDDQYPIRVTVQFYKATSNGVVSERDMADIAEQINKVYQQADYVGSLVLDGPNGRPTEHQGLHVEPPEWWDTFWQRHFQESGQTRAQALERLRTLLGDDWDSATPQQAEAALNQADADAAAHDA